jgi:biliverdin reductase
MKEATGGPLRWAVIGVGTAGRARANAIRADGRCTLVAVHRGRHAAELGVPIVDSLLTAIAQADAVAIASPTALHPDQARTALEHGRHVVVEFPLAADAATAEALFDLARARGKVLHVEHIELLDAPSSTLAAHVRPELVESATVAFQGQGPTGATAPELALGNVARLHRLTACCGPVSAIRSVEHEPGRLSAELSLESGATAAVTFERGPYFSRKTTLRVTAAGRTWLQTNDLLERDGAPVTLMGSSSLFATDHRRAMARILDGAGPYVSEERILHVLRLVERLGGGRTGPVPHRSVASSST